MSEVDFLQASNTHQAWKFILGHSAPRDFERWLCSDPSIQRIFGEKLYLELISADYRDRAVVGDLKDCLYEWALDYCPPQWQWLRSYHVATIGLGDGSYRRLLPIGYWRSEDYPFLPHPRDCVDPSWDEAERLRVIAYLDKAYVICGWMGYSWCRMGCPPIPPSATDIGTRDMTDGTWYFPEGFAHYLRHHAVRPEAVFLEHVRRNGYHIPDLPLRRIRS
jgi:hypothetical protein